MPVLGHGFVGLAAGLATRRDEDPPGLRGLWLPGFVGLSYVPDIAAQLGTFAGVSDAGAVAHSAGFALGFSVIVAGFAARFAGVRPGRAFALVFLVVGLHVLMDVLQATNRVVWWPFSPRTVRLASPWLPPSGWGEGLLFGGLFGLFVLLRFLWRRRRGRIPMRPVVRHGRRERVGHLLTGLIFVLAGGTHALRSIRAGQFDRGQERLARRDFAGALAAFRRAEGWPGAGKPGRIDYGKAEAYLGLGDRARAERYYLASLRADPDYFWALADLAVFYASTDEPVAVRRVRVRPYLERLRTDFADHPRLPRVMARVRRRLAVP